MLLSAIDTLSRSKGARAGCGLGAGRGVCAGADSGLTSTDAIGVLADEALNAGQ